MAVYAPLYGLGGVDGLLAALFAVETISGPIKGDLAAGAQVWLAHAGLAWLMRCAGIRFAPSSGVRALICFIQKATPRLSHSAFKSSAHFCSIDRLPFPDSPPHYIHENPGILL